jgi:hypothetical protein
MSAVCPVCGCEQGAGLLCASETERLERDLGDVAAIVAELDTALSKQARIGNAGGPSGLARERTPINVGAMNVADDLQNTLTTWARDISESSGWVWVASKQPPSQQSANVLLHHIDVIRRHPAVEELVDEITDAIAQARRVVDRPADRTYFGPCYAETPDDQGRAVTCLEEIWAKPTASHAACKVCGVTHEVEERREWLMDKAEDMIVTPREASRYIGEIGHLTVGHQRIRNYLDRKRILARPSADGVLRLRLGDLLDVLREDAAKRSA